MLIYFIIVPVLIGIFLYICPYTRTGKVVAMAVQTALFVLSFQLFFECRQGDIVEKAGNFEGLLGITLRLDSLSSVFVMLAAFIFLIASIYSYSERYSRLFNFLMFIWEGLLIGILLTGDMFSIFVLLEVVTLTVSVLIMFKRDDRSMYDGLFYLMVNTVAVQFFLFGAGYVYKITGTFDMNAAAAALAQMDKSDLVLPFSLIMASICLKCALVPMYSWLPKAHGTPGAPPSVSAILSGLHVKSGIYLFLRFSDMFAGVFVKEIFLAVGIITGVAGFVFALSQKDIKLILAYHTVSQIGIIITGFSFGSMQSYTGALYHVFNHALFKSALFLCAGIIADVYKTRDITKIRGVFKRMPVVGAAIVMAVMGITGAPFFNGSISKYFIMSDMEGLVSAAIMLINLGTVVSFIKFSVMLKGPAVAGIAEALAGVSGTGGGETVLQGRQVLPVKIDAGKKASILILGTLCLAGGILGEQAIVFFFGIDLKVSPAGYLEKMAYFLASLVAGFFIYKYYVTRSRLLVRLKEFDLGFRATCAILGGFFGILLAVTAAV